MSYKDLAKICGKKNIPGTKAYLYIQVQSAFSAIPEPMASPSAAGDTKILEGSYTPADVAPAPQGFAKIPIIVNSGDLMHKLAGELAGTKSYSAEIPFQIAGNGAEQLEFADDVLKYDGCSLAIIEDRNGNRYQIGDLDVPVELASVETALGKKSGEPNQGTYLLRCETGLTVGILAAAVVIPGLA